MKPYTFTLSSDEHGQLYRTLKASLFCAHQQAKIHVIGAEQIVRQIEEAIIILNKPLDGGFENDDERFNYQNDYAMREMNKWGCD